MSKRNAGIFDPWRQTAPPALEEPQKATRILSPLYEDDAQAHCVQFPGVRAGINVWLNGMPEDPSHDARGVLVDLVHRLNAIPEVANIFSSWRIFMGKRDEPNSVVLGDENKMITVASPDEGEHVVRRAVDSLSLALRECAETKTQAPEIILAMKVKPYVK